MKVGGPAALLVSPGSAGELFGVLEVIEAHKTPYVIVGNGSNLIFDDEGFDGIVVQIGSGLDHVRIEGNIVFVEAGALLTAVARTASQAGLTGMEFACGIPGSVGGAVYMNGGAYGGEMSQIVHSVSSISRAGIMKDRPGKALGFAYRKSIFQENEETILGVKLLLAPGDPAVIQEKIRAYTQKRTTRQPLQFPSSGSFFRRPAGHFAGGLIEEAGLKGLSCGGAQVSALHAGFIINTGEATAADILDLMRIVQETVLSRTGILLEPEVRIVSKDGSFQHF
ncbi:MAG TPA: hypothetical protein DF480_06930 [Clostridiales bacterium]|nr:hypothetical protein [Clostridiales bacterium]